MGKKNNGKHFVAKIDNKIIGFATVGPDKDGWRLWRIYLSPEYIRKGIGLMILKNCERFLKKQNAKKYFCYVHQKNEIGKKFYLKSGFKHTADKDKEIEWYMEKSL